MKQKHISFSMKMGLCLSVAAILASASSPFIKPSGGSDSGDFTWAKLAPPAVVGPLMADALIVAESDKPADLNGLSNAPDLRDTSGYMIGKVAVSVILPESIGGTEEWTTIEISTVKNEIETGLDNWAAWYALNNGGDPGLSFVIEWHTNSDAEPAPVSDEPIAMTNGMDDQDIWINEALGNLGAVGATYWERAYAYDNTIRTANSADWAFTIFVVDSSTDTDGKFNASTIFPSGSFAYSYLNGPFLVMTYDNATWGISQMNEVLAHQVGHIFGAADQYSAGCSGTTTKFGYLQIANSNCGGGTTTASLMYAGQGGPDITTRQQVGWLDTDADDIFDPADTRPVITDFVDETPLFTGTNHIFHGTANDNPLSEATIPITRPITIRELIAIQFSIDGGAWQDASITTDTLDSDRENFDFATPSNLGGGIHTVDVRAQNNSNDPVNKYSVVGADQLGISRLTMDFSNDRFDLATGISSLPYTSTGINTTTYTANDPQDLNLIACGGDIDVNRTAGDHSAWYRYTPTLSEGVTLDTLGSNVGGDTTQFDTMIGVFRDEGSGTLSQVDCDDDGAPNLKSTVTVPLLAGRTYYFAVSSFNGIPPSGGGSAASEKQEVGPQAGGFDPGGNLVFNIISNGVIGNIIVDIAGVNKGAYEIMPGSSQRVTYALDSGPVKVASTNSVLITAALRDAWLVNGQVTSFAQLMGLPKEKLSDTYLFPAYNNITLSEQIRFGNVGNTATTVTVKIAGILRGTYPLNPNQGLRVTYPLDTGPVEVKSSGGVPIIAAIRDAWLVNGQVTSFTQIMGLPKESLSDTYLFPAYNNVTLSGQLRFGNVGVSATTVTVKIAGAVVGTYNLNPNESTRVTYPLDTGPVEVKSSGGVKIIAALRDAWLVNGQVTSFAQLMGLPKEALSDTYLFPAYNNVTLSGQLRFGNVGVSATTVTVTIGGVVRGTYNLNPSESLRVTYPLDTGPVKIKSSGGVPIIAALRDAWLVNGAVTSFTQMMGLPNTQLSDTYWIPAYNNITLSGQLRFGVP